MADLTNIETLIKRVEPESFLALVKKMLHEEWPCPDIHQGKRARQKTILSYLNAQSRDGQHDLAAVAGKILMLVDNVGKDALRNACSEALHHDDWQTLFARCNQYERSLWLFLDHPLVFREALEKLDVVFMRRSNKTCKGFKAGRNQIPDQSRVELFLPALSQYLNCPQDQIAITAYEKGENGQGEPEYYDIRCHYNRAPESRDQVQASELVSTDIILADSIYLRYDLKRDELEVMSYQSERWAELSGLFCRYVLDTTLEGEVVGVRTYDLVNIAHESFEPDLSVYPQLMNAKVTSLGWRYAAKSLSVSSSLKDPDTVHSSARALAGQMFTPSDDYLNKVGLTLKVKADEPGERARSVAITLTGPDRCSIKCTREQDETMAMAVLEEWGIARMIEDEASATG